MPMVGARRCAAVAALGLALAGPAFEHATATPLSSDDIATLCANADGSAHCGRLIEDVQLKRLPNLAIRDGATLKVSLYPAGIANFTDTDSADGGRSYSLWDYLDPINAVLLYTVDGDQTSFTLLQRASGRQFSLPNEPKLSPNRQRLVTADFCPAQCVNELALWRVSRDGIRKESAWKPAQPWSDAGVSWKDADTLLVEYTTTGGKTGTLERRLTDPGWIADTP